MSHASILSVFRTRTLCPLTYYTYTDNIVVSERIEPYFAKVVKLKHLFLALPFFL